MNFNPVSWKCLFEHIKNLQEDVQPSLLTKFHHCLILCTLSLRIVNVQWCKIATDFYFYFRDTNNGPLETDSCQIRMTFFCLQFRVFTNWTEFSRTQNWQLFPILNLIQLIRWLKKSSKLKRPLWGLNSEPTDSRFSVNRSFSQICRNCIRAKNYSEEVTLKLTGIEPSTLGLSAVLTSCV